MGRQALKRTESYVEKTAGPHRPIDRKFGNNDNVQVINSFLPFNQQPQLDLS